MLVSTPEPPSRFISSLAWWAISLATCALSAIGLSDAGYSQPPGSLGAIVLWLSLGVIVAGLLYEAQRDLFETTQYLAWIGASTAAFAAVVGLRHPSALAFTVAGVGAVFWVASIAFRMWNQRSTSRWPDILLERTDLAAIHEVHGVQFTAAATAVITGAEAVDVEMLLQNCVDAPRSVHLDLVPEGHVHEANRAILVPSGVVTQLGPGEVAKVTLRCVAAARAHGTHTSLWRVVATGPRGARVRRRRAQSLKVPLLTELISLFSALSMGARGRKVAFSVVPSSTDVLRAVPSYRVESLWAPAAKGDRLVFS